MTEQTIPVEFPKNDPPQGIRVSTPAESKPLLKILLRQMLSPRRKTFKSRKWKKGHKFY
jgi:hypothetical protein